MADPGEFVPFDDPSMYCLNPNYVLNMTTHQTPTSSNFAGPSSSSVQAPISEGELGNSDILLDQTGWEWLSYQQNPRESSAAGPSNVDGVGSGGGSGGGGETSNQLPENVDPQIGSSFVDMRQLLVWPIAPVPFLCSCCHVLREIVYTNGLRFRKLEIHGKVGLISHAIFEDRPTFHPNSSNSQYQMFDFCNNNVDEIKLFLLQYKVNNVLSNYCPVPEPMSFFYDSLCVGMRWDDNATPQNSNERQPPPSNQPPPLRLPPLPPPPGNSGPSGGGLGDRRGVRKRTRT